MNTAAAAVRKRKEAHPELYCAADPKCLWYIGPGGKPCAKHPVRAAAPAPASAPLTSDQVRANIAAQDALRAERAAAGLCRNCGRPVVPWTIERAKDVSRRRVCEVSTDGSYSCGKPLFADVEDQRLPAVEDAP